MVGTAALTRYSKVDSYSDDFDNVKDSMASDYPQNENGILIDNNGTLPQGNATRSNWFRYLYLFVFFLLLISSSLLLICALRKLWIFSNKIETTASSGLTGRIYAGSEQYITWPDPPPHDNISAVARYVMHISEWGSLSTLSTHKGIEGFPFVNVFSVSDGPVDNSTGVPYFYLTPMELSVKDMEKNTNVSFTVSEAQSDYCHKKGFDPEDPRCAHVIFTGVMKTIANNSTEEKFARLALFSRHSEMKDWPPGHAWFFAKLEIVHIYVLDYFGGAGVVSVEDYFASNPFN